MKAFVSLILFLSFLIYDLNAAAKPPTVNYPIVNYIVIGAGTAGSVVANRLSTKHSVIVIHNGKNQTLNPLIALAINAYTVVPMSLVGPPFYQNGLSTPQPDLDNRQLPWVVAVPLGGSSSINGGAYCRGTNENYDQWKFFGGEKWSRDRINEIYKSLEDYHGLTPNPDARGFSGPLSIYQVPNPGNVSLTFNEAVRNSNTPPNSPNPPTPFPLVVDYNDPKTPIGASPQMQFTASGPNGEYRVSSANAFLNSTVINGAGNGVNGHHLRILYESHALRVIIKNQTAVGVEYYHRGKIERVYADKGVVISAGLKSSPILMQSGIGDSSLLSSLNIPVVYHNPNVGKNLIDDAFIILGFSSNPNDTPVNSDPSVLTPLNSALALLFESPLHKQRLEQLKVPNLLPAISDGNGIFKQIAFLPDPAGPADIREFVFSVINPIPGVTLALFYIVQPKSRGVVSINSNDPLAPPVINYGMLNADDEDLFVRGFVTYIQNINLQLQLIDPTYQLIWPDPAIISDPFLLREFIKLTVTNSMHFQGHCRMAPLEQGGVVDGNGRVYGVSNLYVADNSIIPVPMDGTPMASAYMIGENISRMILEP